MKKVLKSVSRILGAIAVIVSVFLIYVQISYKKEFDVPETGIRASKDSSVIARGKYLVMGPGHCWNCHAPDGETNLQSGSKVGMIGGKEFKLPFGVLYSPNITSDTATGIGAFSDEMLAQAIRYSVRPDKTALVPFMSYNGMSDDDIQAVISYLRTTRPVRNKVKENSINVIGKAVVRFVLKPVFSDPAPRASLQPDTTAEYGNYLATSVGNCVGCHTRRDKNTGEFSGSKFAGGYQISVSNGTFTTPNLTPHATTGAIVNWRPGDFVQRFRTGAVYPQTPMPWKSFQTLTDNDLKALYYYFKSLKPVDNKVIVFQQKVPD